MICKVAYKSWNYEDYKSVHLVYLHSLFSFALHIRAYECCLQQSSVYAFETTLQGCLLRGVVSYLQCYKVTLVYELLSTSIRAFTIKVAVQMDFEYFSPLIQLTWPSQRNCDIRKSSWLHQSYICETARHYKLCIPETTFVNISSCGICLVG